MKSKIAGLILIALVLGCKKNIPNSVVIDEKTGLSKVSKYDDSGMIIMEAYFIEGEEEFFRMNQYYKNGIIKSHNNLKAGFLNGIQINYDTLGNLEFLSSYILGKKDGLYIQYGQNKSIIKLSLYNLDTLIAQYKNDNSSLSFKEFHVFFDSLNKVRPMIPLEYPIKMKELESIVE